VKSVDVEALDVADVDRQEAIEDKVAMEDGRVYLLSNDGSISLPSSCTCSRLPESC
jgi:hypothetical protein